MTEEKKLLNLIAMANYHTNLYDLGTPIITDQSWDEIYFQIQELEEKLGIYHPHSPTQHIPYDVVNELKKVGVNPQIYYAESHEESIENLKTAFSINEVDSIFCFSDFIAFKVVKQLYKLNRTDIVVVGVDNIQNEIPFPFEILSIGQNKEKIANDVIGLLFKQILNASTDVNFIVENIFLVE